MEKEVCFQEEKVNFRTPGVNWSYADNLIGRNFFYLTGNLTTEKGKFGDGGTPLSVRAARADDFHRLEKLREEKKEILANEINDEGLEKLEKIKQERKEIRERNKNLLSLSKQFLNDRKMTEVDLGELGVQKAQCVELTPNGVREDASPIVLILGISNDLEGAGSLPLYLALETKRKVVVFSYPDSQRGSVTRKYCEAVEKSENFEPYVDFFEEAINQVVGSEEEIDLCGFSTGSVISALLLSKKGFNKRVDQVNLMVPPGITKATPLNTVVRLVFEGVGIIKQLKNFPKVNPNTWEIIEKTREEIETTKETHGHLYRKLTKEYPWWKDPELKSMNDKKIKVIICDNDGVTWGRVGKKKLEENKNLEVKIIEGGWPHMTPACDPRRAIKEMNGYKKREIMVEEKKLDFSTAAIDSSPRDIA